ncbi:MAG TPA: aminotransferase class I/II-fold pyridoxal phosphate-dependent enzyme, partial [Dehalococcoidia bacterium]|nr:aminotransferase class I/II-fold pyridoxal phosphate-dependent enzyme [Dehalococcoidia bacterium]
MDLVSASGIRRFFELIDTTDGVISLGVGEPDFSTPNHISQAAIRSIEDGETAYTSNFGLFELRELIASQLDRLYGVSYDPQNEIIVTTGVSEALNLATQCILDEGDEVISTDPSYVAYMPNVVFAGGKFVTVPVKAEDGFQLTADALEAAITPSTKAVLLGYPANPTGAVMSRTSLDSVAEVVQRHDLFVVADEIYDRLVYGVEHV